MKGFIDERGNDRPACVNCKYRNKPTVFVLCYNCISLLDLASHKSNYETEFVNFVEGDPIQEGE
mgnify:CR=1 FL=1